MSVEPKEVIIFLMAHLASCNQEECCLRALLGPEFARPLPNGLPNVNGENEA